MQRMFLLSCEYQGLVKILALFDAFITKQKGEFYMSYEKPQVKRVDVNISVRNMATDTGSCHGGHCVKCIQAYG